MSIPRPITKEEKEKENNKKSSPTKPYAPGRGKIPGTARPVEIGKTLPDGLAFSRSRKDNIRHHLERTTGPDAEEGALLPSPTREKLMPAIPRSKGDSPQRGSPQKTGLSRHGSPQKGSPQKSSPKKITNKGWFFGKISRNKCSLISCFRTVAIGWSGRCRRRHRTKRRRGRFPEASDSLW